MFKKSIIIIIPLMLLMHGVFSQTKTSLFTIAPAGLINKAKFKYESPITEHLSLGTYVIMFVGPFQWFPGAQGQPFMRYYFKPTAPEGFYFQGKAVFGYHASANGMYAGTTIGAGLAGGYQMMIGNKKNIPVDFALGFKYNTYPYSTGPFVEGDVSPFAWQTIGPGSILDATIAIGIAFE